MMKIAGPCDAARQDRIDAADTARVGAPLTVPGRRGVHQLRKFAKKPITAVDNVMTAT
jgi:hypothetical protein